MHYIFEYFWYSHMIGLILFPFFSRFLYHSEFLGKKEEVKVLFPLAICFWLLPVINIGMSIVGTFLILVVYFAKYLAELSFDKDFMNNSFILFGKDKEE